MTLLTTADLAWMRSVQAEARPDVITIVHPTTTADGQGGYTYSACTSTSYMGRISLVGGMEEYAPGRFTRVERTKLTLPHDAAVSASDLAYDADGRKFRVVYVDDAKSWNTALRCDVERMS